MPKLLVIGGVFFAIAALLLGYLALTLYMTSQEGVVLKTDKKVYSKGDVVKVKLVNLGGNPVWFGSAYRVEYYNGSAWVLSDELTPDFFTMELRMLQPGHSFEWTIQLGGADPGKYRVVKEVWLDNSGNERITLYAEFEVEG